MGGANEEVLKGAGVSILYILEKALKSLSKFIEWRTCPDTLPEDEFWQFPAFSGNKWKNVGLLMDFKWASLKLKSSIYLN